MYEECRNFAHSGLKVYFDTLLAAMRLQRPAQDIIPRDMNAKGYDALVKFFQGNMPASDCGRVACP